MGHLNCASSNDHDRFAWTLTRPRWSPRTNFGLIHSRRGATIPGAPRNACPHSVFFVAARVPARGPRTAPSSGARVFFVFFLPPKFRRPHRVSVSKFCRIGSYGQTVRAVRENDHSVRSPGIRKQKSHAHGRKKSHRNSPTRRFAGAAAGAHSCAITARATRRARRGVSSRARAGGPAFRARHLTNTAF